MIEMNLSHEGLETFDASEVHKEWKDIYGEIENIKASDLIICENQN